MLFDSGAAKLLGPGLCYILQSLKAAGYEAGQVDIVVITHLHGDHISGLIRENGQAAFPNTRVFAA